MQRKDPFYTLLEKITQRYQQESVDINTSALFEDTLLSVMGVKEKPRGALYYGCTEAEVGSSPSTASQETKKDDPSQIKKYFVISYAISKEAADAFVSASKTQFPEMDIAEITDTVPNKSILKQAVAGCPPQNY